MDLENGPIKTVQSVFERTNKQSYVTHSSHFSWVIEHTCSWQTLFWNALSRPFVLFMYEPIMQLLGIYMALLYGIFYRA